jgi:DNA-binding SARP family transcriptional activator
MPGDPPRRVPAGDAVRDRRRELGLSQSGLAQRAGVSIGMLRDLEQGRTTRPHPSSLSRLSATLGFDVAVLLARPEPEPEAAAAPPPLPAPTGLAGTLELRVLGTFEARRDAAPVTLRAGKQRNLVALLALNAGVPMHGDSLIDLLWQEAPPARAHRLLGEYVRGARVVLSAGPRPTAREDASRGEDRELIERIGRGFRLDKSLVHRDADEFLELSEHGRGALIASRYDQATGLMEQALRLWRGEVLQDIDAARNLPELIALQRQRARTVLNLVDAYCALGLHGEALEHLEAAAVRDPFDESIQAKLLLTLARSGRQAEALARYRGLSVRFDRELGIRPGPELAETQRRILNRELGWEGAASSHLRAAAPRIPRHLPPDSALFTGRETEVAGLIERVARASVAADAPAATVVTIDGMAGIGKTAFATRVAHQVSGRYPDGQLFVDLRGHSTGMPPRDPSNVLGELLSALGTPVELIPEDIEARSALYRDRLADTKTLVVLDNASSIDQVTRLLPSSSGCLVLVTSRRRFASLDEAHQITLTVLSDEDGLRLLVRTANLGAPAEQSLELRELATLCGNLPLALRIVGAMLRRTSRFTPESLAGRLRETLSGQDPLSAFNDGERNLRSVFDLSYRTLHRRHADLFRKLGLMPGTDIDAYGAAALAGLPVPAARDLMGDLVDHNLLVETEPGRFRLHDLLRLDAWTRAQQDGEDAVRQAGDRLFDYLEGTARRADAFIRPGAAPPPGRAGADACPRIESRTEAIAWMRTEIRNLIAATRRAIAAGSHRRVVSMTAALHGFLQSQGPLFEAVELQAAAVEAARRDEDPRVVARPLARLGLIHRLTGNTRAAVTAFDAALEALGPDVGGSETASVLGELGEAYRQSGDFRRTEETLHAALAAHEAAGDLSGRAGVLVKLSLTALMKSPNPYDAIPALDEAVGLYRAVGDQAGMATALSQAGDIHRICGDYAKAEHALRTALDCCRAVDDPVAQALVLLRYGYLRHLLGDLGTAWRAIDEAFRIYVGLGTSSGKANALDYIGSIQADTGEYARALETFAQARELYVACGSERGS